MQLMTDTVLKQIRLSLGLSQEGLARRTKTVSTGTIKNAERGSSVKYDTAQQLLEAINGALRDAGRSEVTMDDLGLTIY